MKNLGCMTMGLMLQRRAFIFVEGVDCNMTMGLMLQRRAFIFVEGVDCNPIFRKL